MTNGDAEVLAERFLQYNDSRAFEKLWDATVNMAHPYKYFDPTGARTTDDFLQVTRIGLLQALRTYNKEKGSTLLSWIRMRMTQLLIKELRRMSKNSLGYKISLDTSIDWGRDSQQNNITVEQLIYDQLIASDSYQSATQQWSEELYWQIIIDVEERIERNRILSKCFSLKLTFPNVSRSTICYLLNISRPAVSHYFETIRTCIKLATEKYAF